MRTSETESSPSVGIELLRRHGAGVVNRTVREHEDGPTPPPRSARPPRSGIVSGGPGPVHAPFGPFRLARKRSGARKSPAAQEGDTGRRARRYSTTRPRGETIIRCLRQKNFPDPGRGELLRIHLPRTRVNTARTRRAQRTDVPHDDLEEAKIRRQKGVYVTMPFQTHQRNVVGGCWERTETPTRIRTGRSGCCLQMTTPCSGRALRGYWSPTGAWRS